MTLIKKSQAALEFLTTYAWAFIVIAIMIAALVYFGILSPSKLLPDRCIFGSEFECIAHVLGTNGVSLKLKSNVAEPIIISAINASSENGQLSCASPLIGAIWNPGEIKGIPIQCDFSNSIKQGGKEKVNLNIKYHSIKAGEPYTKEANGEIFTIVMDSSPQVSLLTNLVGWWSFDELSGIIAADSSGMGNDGNLINGLTWTTGKKGNALNFDGTDDYVNIGTTGLPTSNTNGTWSFWIYPYQGSSGGIFDTSENIGANTAMRIMTSNDNTIVFGIGWLLDHNINVGTNISNKWSHIALTRSQASVWKLYFNGALNATITDTNSWTHNAAQLGRFSYGAGYQYFNGTIDEVRIYNKSLTSAEVLAEYNS